MRLVMAPLIAMVSLPTWGQDLANVNRLQRTAVSDNLREVRVTRCHPKTRFERPINSSVHLIHNGRKAGDRRVDNRG